MSATKIAASFRISVTALVPKQPDHRLALAWLRFHAALRRTWKQGAQPCVSTGRSIDAMLNIARVGEGGIGKRAETRPAENRPSRARPQGVRPSRRKNKARPIAHGARRRPESVPRAATANGVKPRRARIIARFA
jgi:hypothetical protein